MWKRLYHILEIRQYPREAHIHTLNRIGHINQHISFFSQLLNIIPRGRIIRYIRYSRKPIQTIPDSDIQSLPENAISVGSVCDDLTISSTYIEDGWVGDACG